MLGFGKRRARPSVQEDRLELDLGSRAIPLLVRRDPRAMRLTLRLDTTADQAVVTIPASCSVAEGMRLAQNKTAWLRDLLDSLPPRIAFEAGAVVPVLGVDRTIERIDALRGGVTLQADRLLVRAASAHLPRRVRDFLKAEARRRIEPLADAKAQAAGATRGRITLRDTRSRWGSCAAGGELSFCWRLVMAPEWVLDYVVAHEIAHLRHRDHGPNFWALADQLAEGEPGKARAWLRENGARLHRYG